MKIRAGEWYCRDDEPGQAVRAGSDVEDESFYVVEVRVRRTIRPRVALAWLMAQTGWRIIAHDDDGLARRFYVSCGALETGLEGEGHGETLTKAIIALRKAVGVR